MRAASHPLLPGPSSSSQADTSSSSPAVGGGVEAGGGLLLPRVAASSSPPASTSSSPRSRWRGLRFLLRRHTHARCRSRSTQRCLTSRWRALPTGTTSFPNRGLLLCGSAPPASRAGRAKGWCGCPVSRSGANSSAMWWPAVVATVTVVLLFILDADAGSSFRPRAAGAWGERRHPTE